MLSFFYSPISRRARMFDKYKARFAKFEEDHEAVRKVRIHFEENRDTYLVGVGCLGAGYLLRSHSSPDVVQTFTDSTDNIGTVINRSKNVDVVIKYLNARNYNAQPVRCLETLQEFPSQKEAAEAFKMASNILSQHLNGKFEHAKGFHFERI